MKEITTELLEKADSLTYDELLKCYKRLLIMADHYDRQQELVIQNCLAVLNNDISLMEQLK